MAKLWRTKVQKRRAYSVALLLMAGTLSGCLGWSAQLSTSDGSSFSAISCPGASQCFAVGSTTQGSAFVKQTVNGGAQWASDTTGVSGSALTAISCSDSEDCVAVGGGGSVLVTTDGGSTWRASTVATDAESFTSVSCPDTEDCWAATSPPIAPGGTPGQGGIWTTEDGGTTWSAQSWSPPDFSDGFTLLSASINAVRCTTTNDCVAVGIAIYYGIPPAPALPNWEQQGVFATTDDGGQTWQTQLGPEGQLSGSCCSPSSPDDMTGVSCPTSLDCIAVGTDSTFQVSRTDEDTTWSIAQLASGMGLNGAFPYINAIACATSLHCIAVGAPSTSPEYSTPVIVTTDGGHTWSNQSTNPGNGVLQGVACVSSSHCWAVGSTANGGLILATMNGGVATPNVSGISPSQGPGGGGTLVTITGSGFAQGVSSVSFGSALATDVTVDSDSQLTVVSPPSASPVPPYAFLVDVTVTSTLGPSPLNPNDEFNYVGQFLVTEDGGPAFSTSAAPSTSRTFDLGVPGELIVASVATYNGATVTVSGGGLAWSNVLNQADSVSGDGGRISVWAARAPSTVDAEITVTSSVTGNAGWDQTLEVAIYGGAGGIGATAFASGPSDSPPSLAITPQQTGSWVAVVGFDADSVAAATPGTGQVLDGTLPDYTENAQMWFQHYTGAVTASQAVTVRDALVPAGRWDLGAVEIVPKP